MRIRRWTLCLAWCAGLAACQTDDTRHDAASTDPAACRSACNAAFDQCSADAAQQMDDDLAPEACVERVGACKQGCE